MLGALPGIREIRSALAGGYLWILFLWLLLDPSLGEGDFDAQPYQSADHLGDVIGPAALGISLTFAAYLIGTFMNEIRGFLSKLYLEARQSAGVSPSPEERAQIAERERMRGRVALTRLRALLSGSSRTVEKESTEKTKQQPSRNVPVLTIEVAGAAVEIALSGMNRLVAALGRAASVNESVLQMARALSEIRIEPFKPYLSNQGVLAIERYLERSQEEGHANHLGVADVISDFSVIRARLIHLSPDTVNEVDRLGSEADFRSAIAPPLLAIVGVLVCGVSPWWLAALPVLVMLLMTARAKRRESGDLIADSLARNVIEAPSVEAEAPRG